MFKKFSLGFIASAAWFGAGLPQARAIDAAAPFGEPVVIYADRPMPREAPLRTAMAERSGMGGGFIEFLFGDGQGMPPQPSYQPRPGHEPRQPQMEPQPVMHRQEEA